MWFFVFDSKEISMALFSIVWIVVMFGDLILPFFLATFYKGYRHREMALSVLGCRQSPVKWIYNIWCIISGMVFIFGGFGIFTAVNIPCCILLVLYGIGCEVISGFFPLSATRENLDTSAKIHGITSALGFLCLLFVPLCIGVFGLKTQRTPLSIFAFASFFGAFVCFIFFVMGEKERFQNTILRFGGVWQRLVLAGCYLPIAAYLISLL